MKTIAVSLIMCVSETWLAIYLGGDMIAFLLVKIIRGDFTYWLNLPPSLSLSISLVFRFLTKILTDFTLVMQMRHSYEIGGVQFSLLVVQNQAMCFVAAKLYLKYYDGAFDMEGEVLGGNRKLEAEMLWAGLLGLLGIFLVSSLSFVGLMDRKYLHTFFGLTTGPQYSEIRFRTAKTDEQRIETFGRHPSYYTNVAGELQELIDENWEDWMRDRPEWLTDNLLGKVPDEYLKKAEVKRLEEEGGGKRRRSSAFGGI